MLIYIYRIFLIFWEIFCCSIFFESFVEKRKEISRLKRGELYLLIGLADYLIVTFCTNNFPLKEVVVIAVGSAVFFILFQVKYFQSILFYILYQGCALIVDYFTYLVFQRMFAILPNVMQRMFVEILMGAVSKMLLYCLVLMVKKKYSTKNTDMLTTGEWVRFAAFPIFTVLSMVTMITTWGEEIDYEQTNTLLCISMGMLIMNFLFFHLVQDILKREMQIREDELFRERVQNETAMYRSISENYDIQRRRAHEFKNQIFCIAELAKEKKYQELNRFLAEYEEEFYRSTDMINTNHVIVNAIINSKYAEGRKKGIVFVFQVNDLSGIQLKDEDIVIILSNLLNNAIEACEQFVGEKIIKFKFVKEKKHLIIAASNYYNTPVKIVNGQYQTTKTEKEEHGFGISNIITAVERYQGTYAIETENQEFKFTIMIPI